MTKNIKLTDREYEMVKKNAYISATILTKTQIINHLNEDCFYDSKSDLGIIYRTTLMYPNDIEIIEEYTNGGTQNGHDLGHISKTLGIPQNIIRFKIMEYNKYNTLELFSKNLEIKRLAEQASKFEKLPDENIR